MKVMQEKVEELATEFARPGGSENPPSPETGTGMRELAERLLQLDPQADMSVDEADGSFCFEGNAGDGRFVMGETKRDGTTYINIYDGANGNCTGSVQASSPGTASDALGLRTNAR